eukprot:7355323-Prymnesium_polylepis.1
MRNEHGARQRTHLDRIAERRPCPVRLAETKVVDNHGCVSKNRNNHAVLRLAVGVAVQHASARAYPSARASKVWHRPNNEVRHAMANVTPLLGVSIRFTPAAHELEHSFHCNARALAW